MSLRKYNNRKRRRSPPSPPEEKNDTGEQEIPDEAEEVHPDEEVPQSAMDVDGEAEVDEALAAERAAKELAVWDSFREEHYESEQDGARSARNKTYGPRATVLEQLPLSLHRAYTLVHELDEQVDSTHLIYVVLPLRNCHTPSRSWKCQTTAACQEVHHPAPSCGRVNLIYKRGSHGH